jgi:DNA helicase-2/ATP-dependent DNA helicase PcrA
LRLEKDLNAQQLEAVRHTEGPLLILAGAGSGKTRVLAYRIANILESGLAQQWQIMAVTFTNKAAGEMKQRIESLCNCSGFPHVGTFHSLCARMLRQDGKLVNLPDNFTIYDTTEQQAVVKEVFKAIGFDDRQFTPGMVLSMISKAKNRLVGHEEYARTAHTPNAQVIAELYPRYEGLLRKNGALDFDDLLVKTVQLLRDHPDVLERYADRLRYIMIDEYQDVNFAQYVIVKYLSGKRRNLCAVGDDDQSIYGFRGADVSIILRFEKDYPDSRVIKLEQNYRSTKTILDAANSLVSCNKGRKEKTLWTNNCQGDRIVLRNTPDGKEEARYAVQEIKDLSRRGAYALGDFAILYRTNAQSRLFEDVLLQEGIPYRLVGGLKFYDRREIKDVLAYLRVLVNKDDSVSLRRILNVPPRGLGDVTLKRLMERSNEGDRPLYDVLVNLDGSAGITAKAAKALKELVSLLEDIRSRMPNLKAAEAVGEVIERSGYRRFLSQQDNVENLARLENLDELMNALREFENRSDDQSLGAYLAEVSLLSDIDDWSEDESSVNLMTLHSAKGLEFPVVFICGMEEDLFPHPRSTEKERDIEEERRLCYVGISRAKSRLYLTFSENRNLMGETRRRRPSRFIDEIPGTFLEDCREFYTPVVVVPVNRSVLSDSPARIAVTSKPLASPKEKSRGRFKKGQRVSHRIFGTGTVNAVEGDLISVDFGTVGVKRICQDFLNPCEDRGECRPGDRIHHTEWGTGVVKKVFPDNGETMISAVFPGRGVKYFPLDDSFNVLSGS